MDIFTIDRLQVLEELSCTETGVGNPVRRVRRGRQNEIDGQIREISTEKKPS